MKLTTLLMILMIMQVSAITLAQKVTLAVRNAPLTTVFQQLRKQTGYDFAYTGKTLEDAKTVTINAKNEELKTVLDKIFAGQPLDYSIEDKLVVVSIKETRSLDYLKAVFAAIDVQGHIFDERGQPLSGATIKVKNRTQVTTTDKDGYFLLKSVDENAVLVITFIGFKRLEVGAKADLGKVTLEVESGKLNEVNVVSNGYQTLARERSAGSFAKPDMAVIANRSFSTNILQRLDGLVPGLTINNAPAESQYLIRGLTTVSTNTLPLYVVDGIQVTDVSTINPQDIEDISILKDATAASIWGAKAANGVIVIVTKKGVKGEKMRVTYDAFVNFQGKPNLNYLPSLNSRQFIQAAKETFDPVAYPYTTVTLPTAGSGLAPHEVILYNQSLGKTTAAQANAGLDSLASINNNQQVKDLFYRNAMLMNHTLSVSGGQKSYAVYGSMAYTDNLNNSPGQTNNTYKINLRQDFTVSKRIQLTLITDLNNSFTYSPRNINVTNQFFPYQLFKDNAGNNILMDYMMGLPEATRLDYQTRSRINLDYSPLDEVNRSYTKGDNLQIRNVFNANVKLFDGLTFEGSYGYLKGSSRTRNYDDALSFKVRQQTVQFTVAPTAASTPVYNLPATGGNYQVGNTNNRNWTIRDQLSYNKNWKDGLHQLTMLAGQEAQEQYSIINISRFKGWDPLLQTSALLDYKTLTSSPVLGVWPNYTGPFSLLSASESPSGEQEAPISRFVSYYGNAAYTYNHKYTINGSYRIDKSNNFGIDKSAQNKPVWSAGAKWILTEESFMKAATWADNLALRVTYGLTGNAPNPGTAASYDIVRAQLSSFLPNGRGLVISTPANRKLSWERTATINLGIDFAILKNRLSGSIDIYQKKTTDLLGNVTTDGFTGYPTIFGNIGDLKNKGIEVGITSVNVRSKNFRWSTTLNGAYNKNLITHLNVSAPITTGAGQVNAQLLAGYTAYSLFAYQFAGLDNLGDPQIRLANGTVTKAPNVSKPGDIKYMGTTQPPWSGGFSNNFNYKSFGLSFNAVFNLGYVMRRDVDNFYSGRLSAQAQTFTTENINPEFLNRWKKPGDEATTNIPSFVANSTTSAARRNLSYYTLSDINVTSASFVKMRDITFTYSLPQSLVKKINVDGITLRAQVSNVMLWKANKYGIDPEFQYAFNGTRFLPTGQNTVSFGINVRL
ncbi:MAG: SusC/RagA family TonB-linked outer membrane protein [Mucilaginibacter sp.]|nr:SusC/RagA family TonB-linked outer membrane protein [Mucilaginibacter sp.]